MKGYLKMGFNIWEWVWCIDWDIVRVYDSDIEGQIWQMVVWCIGFDLPSFKYYCKRHRLFNLVNRSTPDWYR